MILTSVKSSNVKAVGYNAESRVLLIQFHNGLYYTYADVPPEVYRDLRNAESVGSFFHKYIKPSYAATKREEE